MNGPCELAWQPQASAAEATLTVGAPTTCVPGASSVFTFNGMAAYNGMTDPFAGVGLSVVFSAGTLTQTSAGFSASGGGQLTTNSGSEAFTYSYTAVR